MLITNALLAQFPIHSGGFLARLIREDQSLVTQEISSALITQFMEKTVTIVPHNYSSAMTDDEFNAWLKDNNKEHVRTYFEGYKQSGILREKCYISVRGINYLQDVTIRDMLSKFRTFKDKEFAVTLVVMHSYNHENIVRNAPGEGLSIQQDVPDNKESIIQALIVYVQNISPKK